MVVKMLIAFQGNAIDYTEHRIPSSMYMLRDMVSREPGTNSTEDAAEPV